jgi:hypothetical protein
LERSHKVDEKDVQVDETAYKQNTKEYESLNKIRQSRLENIKIKESTEKVFALIE